MQDTVAELVLGHVQRGVQAVYNRHSYFERHPGDKKLIMELMTDDLEALRQAKGESS